MNTDDFAASARKTAEELTGSGLHCSEIVARALAQAQGRDSDDLRRVTTGFSGGLSGRRGPCGALMGAVIGIGLAYGRTGVEESELPALYATQQVVDAFERRFGSCNCVDLTGVDLGTPEGLSKFYRDNIGARRCVHFIVEATEIAARIIASAKT